MHQGIEYLVDSSCVIGFVGTFVGLVLLVRVVSNTITIIRVYSAGGLWLVPITDISYFPVNKFRNYFNYYLIKLSILEYFCDSSLKCILYVMWFVAC